MNPELQDNYFTLDWDRITIEKAYERLRFMWQSNKMIMRLKLSMSPCNGYHVRGWTFKNIKVAEIRNLYLDDGRRLVHDIMDNPEHIHDILWNEKEVTPDLSFHEVELEDWHR